MVKNESKCSLWNGYIGLYVGGGEVHILWVKLGVSTDEGGGGTQVLNEYPLPDDHLEQKL